MRILVFGDSIAGGAYDTEKSGWVSLLAIHLYQKTLDSNPTVYNSVFNLSISGQNTTEILARYATESKPRLSSSKKNVVILAAGINDAKRLLPNSELYVPLEQTKRNVDQFIKDAKSVTDKLFVIGLNRVDESLTADYNDDSFYNEDIEMYDQAIRLRAEKQGVTYVPISDLIKLEHLSDGLHPNAEGHRLIFERVKEVLEKENIL